MRFREEVLNVTLAGILREYEFLANAEVVHATGKLPDVHILVGGLKVNLEGRNEKDKRGVQRMAEDRLRSAIADVAIALYYPDPMFEASGQDELKAQMAASSYDGAIFYWTKEGVAKRDLERIAVSDLVELLNGVVSLYIKNDILSGKIEEIDDTIRRLSAEGEQTESPLGSPALERKLRDILNLGEEAGDKDGEKEKN
jgi:hypothetical protein